MKKNLTWKLKWKISLSAVILLIVLIVAGCSSSGKISPELAEEKVTIFKSGSCGCCGVFSKYMVNEGFNVDVQTTEMISEVKQRYNIPANLQSCHTSVVGGYFVEGHIPSEAIEKLLTEKPDIAGIAMPGMPSGSPGMPGGKEGTWVIQAVHHDGSVTEYMRI